MDKVTGIGGIFFTSRDREALMDWYREHLGIASESWGGVFHWREADRPEKRGYSAWCPFAEGASKFDGSERPFMVNYRVADLTALLAELRSAGVTVVGDLEQHENGKFAWIVDPEGQKIELWEPVDPEVDPYLP